MPSNKKPKPSCSPFSTASFLSSVCSEPLSRTITQASSSTAFSQVHNSIHPSSVPICKATTASQLPFSLLACAASLFWVSTTNTTLPNPLSACNKSIACISMTPDFNGSELELQRQLEESLAQQVAQANQTRERLAQLKQSSATHSSQPQPAFLPSNTAFQYPATNSSAHDGRPIPSHGASMSYGALDQSAMVRQLSRAATAAFLQALTGTSISKADSPCP